MCTAARLWLTNIEVAKKDKVPSGGLEDFLQGIIKPQCPLGIYGWITGLLPAIAKGNAK